MNFKSCSFLLTEEWLLDHDCKEVMDEVYSSRPDVIDVLLLDLELKLFIDRRSFVQGGWHTAKFTLITPNDIIQAEALPQGWSAQQAELWTLVQALQYAKGKQVKIYTDSKYAFATLHI
jgi:hypothetical protein